MTKETNKSLICFLHIEKAAGTTLHEIMRNNYWNYYWDSPYIYHPGDKAQEYYLTSQELFSIGSKIPGFKSFGGHSIRIWENYGTRFNKDVLYFTFLRDPIKRYLSNYFFQKYNLEIDRTFEEYLSDEFFSNFMTKKIAGKASYEKAVRIINDYNVFIGFVEEFDASLLMLKRQIDLLQGEDFLANYEKQNVNRGRYISDIDALLIKYKKDIEKNNKMDIRLYNHFYSDFRAKKKDDINEIVKTFSEFNSEFKFRKLKIKLLHRLKRLYFQKLERIFRDDSKRKLSI